MTSKQLGFFLAAMAALQFVAAASDLADLTSPTVASWIALIVGALQVFAAVYTGKVAVTPADPQHPDNLSSNQLFRLARKAESSENV